MKRLEPEMQKRLTSFIEIYSDDVDIQFNPFIEAPLPFSIPVKENEKDLAAHYLLLAASISDIEVSGNARNSRLLLSYICERINPKTNLFDMGEQEFFEKLKWCNGVFRDFSPLGKNSREIPKILSSVNDFVKRKAVSGLVTYSRQLSTTDGPVDMVKALSIIDRMNEYNLAKAWLYLRWMVRGWPSLGLFDAFSPSELQIPLTIPTLRVAKALNQAEKGADDALNSRITLEEWWKNSPEEVETTSRNLNLVAGELFQSDPAKADYPFFILGRWLSGLELNYQTISDTLDLFNNQFDKLKLIFGKKYKPIDFLVIRKQNLVHQTIENKVDSQSDLEKRVMKYLRDANIHTDFEPFTANFPKPRESDSCKPISYTPDFVVRSKKEKGKKVALDPHGNWEESKELKWAIEKWSLFIGTYSNYCKLRIIVPDSPKSLVIEARKIANKKGLKDKIWSENKFRNSLTEEFY